ncbi:MAG: DNA recombination protein RmuC [Chlorobi bacterium]|nr:DNA recombination protein RmuC [Flavobacteriales bacterium]MBL1161305.1 DNA recombination protein RmuC [Chlorobiota bacterium]MBZ0195474.1 DNA recombination protein RmuC [Candidatus Kapabacteria bacterium]MCC6331997.1 DNA recombination protein RmuC [Ignavibacteria bacterium]MBV6463903.1 hypothetical protein [Chlorobiota bacterium]
MFTMVLLAVLVLLAMINLVLLMRSNSSGDAGVLSSLSKLDTELQRIDPLVRDEFSRSRTESQQSFKDNREELTNSFSTLGRTLSATVSELSTAQKNQFDTFSNQLTEFAKATAATQTERYDELGKRLDAIKQDTENKLKEIRDTVESKLRHIQEDNSVKLEEMRKTVDEKLHETVEKRFNESFKVISERLEQVHKGLGEMQTLATGVGDLKRVLTNVKTRGTYGEVQLGTILEQIFSPEQYSTNAVVKPGSLERVEFVINLPGTSGDDTPVLLPIDSKFPVEDYIRLVDAYEQPADPQEIEQLSKQFENAVKKNAKDIRDKYINVPVTTDFAIMFVPTEGLYAEILRRQGLFEQLQREHKVTVVGPTNLVAYLSSLQMGFKTLAIEKRSSEVWELLGAVKTQFGKFGDILDKTKKKLQEATNVIDSAGTRSRVIERKLRLVQELPATEASKLLPDNDNTDLGLDADDTDA